MNIKAGLNKHRTLNKGNKIKLKGKDYIVDELRDIHSDSGKIRGREFILKKESGEGHLKGKFMLMQNEKTGEAKIYKGIEEKEVSPGSFIFKSVKSMVYTKIEK